MNYSVDDVLRDAAARGEFDHLPGKGRPIDLEDYFASGPEHRIVYKLLKDNQALPEDLPERIWISFRESRRPLWKRLLLS